MTQVYNDVRAQLAAIPREAADELRRVETERLDSDVARLARILDALRPAAEAGDTAAVQATCTAIQQRVRVAERRARMLGLDSADKVEIAGLLELQRELMGRAFGGAGE